MVPGIVFKSPAPIPPVAYRLPPTESSAIGDVEAMPKKFPDVNTEARLPFVSYISMMFAACAVVGFKARVVVPGAPEEMESFA